MPFKIIGDTPPQILGAILAGTLAVLRVIYDRSETSWLRIALEGALCVGISFTVSSAVGALDWPQEWVISFGGLIGLIGVGSMRALILKLANKKIDKL